LICIGKILYFSAKLIIMPSNKHSNMHLNRLLGILLGIFMANGLFAQDIHFTQYNMSPMTLNPGLIGGFEGTARVGGIYRNQWSSVIDNEFVTPSFWVDAPIIRGFRKKDWVGVGVMFLSDEAGSVGFEQNSVKFGASYHFALDKGGNTYLTLGAQGGRLEQKIDNARFQFEDKLLLNDPMAMSSDPFAAAQSGKGFDLDAGVVLKSRLNKRMDVTLGFSMYHLLEPEISLFEGGTGDKKQARRPVFTGVYNVELTDRWTFSPSFLFQTRSGNDEIIVQGMGNYLFDPEKDISFDLGLGYRLGDALSVMGGVRWKDLRVGLAYDINTSDLNTVSNSRGGFEIAANYIFKIFKEADVDPQILCPRF